MYTIEPGQGIDACRVGSDKQTAVQMFGVPESVTIDDHAFLVFPKAGIDVAYDHQGKITTIFCFFRDADHAPFQGRTDLGIGMESSPDDVLSRYGTPTQTSEFTEKTFFFGKQGISFTFKEGKLSDISICKPTASAWPDEWPLRPFTPEMSWIAFADDANDWMIPVQLAQASFLEFARVAELEHHRILPTFEAIGIKAFFESMPGNPMLGEHIYLTEVYTNGKTITATLNASAFRRADLKEGQQVTFPIEHLSDWFLVRAGRGWGGFTMPQVLAQLPSSEQEQARNAEPFRWFAHRNISAADELIAVAPCPTCKQRNLIDIAARKAPCAICSGNGRRCDCPKCGAPLIRFDKLPKVCSRCPS